MADKIKGLPIPPADKTAFARPDGQALPAPCRDGSVMQGLVRFRESGLILEKHHVPLETVFSMPLPPKTWWKSTRCWSERQAGTFRSACLRKRQRRTHAGWDEDKKQKSFGKSRIADTLWIMVPLLFLALACFPGILREFHVLAGAR